MSLTVEINKEEMQRRFNDLKKKFLETLKKSMKVNSLLIVDYLRRERMRGGTTDYKLRKRSGNLASGTKPMTVEVKGTQVEGGIQFGSVYARVHIGPRGQVTTIKPKTKKYLTIPIEGSQIMDNSGRLKATAAELKTGAVGLPFGETFIKRSKKGNLIIFGKQRVSKGVNIGEMRGGIIPLFLLKKEVKVKARIHPEEIMEMAKKLMVEDLKSKGIKVNA